MKQRDIAEKLVNSLIYPITSWTSPITPWVNPLDAEKEMEGALLDAKEILEQLEKGTYGEEGD